VFRAQDPGQKRAVYRWHQDEGTWFAAPSETLAYRMPGTLWLSINGATAANSIELIPRSHRCGLRLHRNVEGQGYFDADPPEGLPAPVAMTTSPGDGVLFHALTFHRSIVTPGSLAPRYSADLRYYDPSRRGRYQVDPALLRQREAVLSSGTLQ
jgi:ectoine hydroxylase-related dioxygenase (phytanoyl-CoA dioxygenase family)